MHFAISLLYPLGNGRGPSFEQTWIPITQRCFVSILVEIDHVALKKNFKVHQCIFDILLSYPLRKACGPSLEQTWILITQELALWFFRRRQCMFAISLLSPLGKGRGPSFEQTWIPITKGCFVPSLVKIDPVHVVLKKKMKMWKVYRQTDRQTDKRTYDGQQVFRKAHLSRSHNHYTNRQCVSGSNILS